MTSCVQACCLLLRGKVYIQIGDNFPRLVGNSSRLSVSHTISNDEPLDGSLGICDPIDAVNFDLNIKCVDLQNIQLGFQAEQTDNDSESIVETINLPDVLNPGDLIPFQEMADIRSVSAVVDWLNTVSGQKFRKGIEYEVTPAGLEILKCVIPPTISPTNKILTLKYKSIETVRSDVGQFDIEDAKLIYVGVNAFDESPAILTIPQIRFDPIDNFDFINDVEAEINISGSVIPQNTSPKWYSLTRPSTKGC